MRQLLLSIKHVQLRLNSDPVTTRSAADVDATAPAVDRAVAAASGAVVVSESAYRTAIQQRHPESGAMGKTFDLDEWMFGASAFIVENKFGPVCHDGTSNNTVVSLDNNITNNRQQ